MNLPTIALALALLVPVSAQAATIIIDGDTIDIDGVRIRIVQIDTPETFGPRCENELILGLKAKKRLRELLDSGTVPRKHHGGFSDEARDCDRDVDGIAGPVRGLAGSQPKPKPDTKRTTTCLEDLESPVPPTCNKRAAELTRRVSEEAQSNYPETPTYPGNDE